MHHDLSLPRRNCPRGFTLLELLVVVTIIALLSTIVIPKFFKQLGNANVSTAKAQMRAIADAMTQYRLNTGQYPSTQQGLSVLLTQPSGVKGWLGPYLTTLPKDPWGNAYIWRYPGKQHEAEVVSLGEDGAPGGEGAATDIVLGL